MKSAEQWREEAQNDPGLVSDLAGWIDQIQKDAMANTSNAELVLELNLCEQDKIVLRPGKLYRFTVDPTCRHCVLLYNNGKLPEEPTMPTPPRREAGIRTVYEANNGED